jgi:coenzyme F420 hydrogenase subunit delta
MTTARMEEILPDHCAKDVVVLCCGNILFGDDGFGPAVAERLNAEGEIPDWAVVIDAGTAVRELLFDMVLSERRPRLVVVVDAVDMEREPGEVFEIALASIPRVKVSEFSVHQAPTSNLLQELEEVGNVRVAVIVCQVTGIPEEMTDGLSPEVSAAVDRAAQLVRGRFLREKALAETSSA